MDDLTLFIGEYNQDDIKQMRSITKFSIEPRETKVSNNPFDHILHIRYVNERTNKPVDKKIVPISIGTWSNGQPKVTHGIDREHRDIGWILFTLKILDGKEIKFIRLGIQHAISIQYDIVGTMKEFLFGRDYLEWMFLDTGDATKDGAKKLKELLTVVSFDDESYSNKRKWDEKCTYYVVNSKYMTVTNKKRHKLFTTKVFGYENMWLTLGGVPFGLEIGRNKIDRFGIHLPLETLAFGLFVNDNYYIFLIPRSDLHKKESKYDNRTIRYVEHGEVTYGHFVNLVVIGMTDVYVDVNFEGPPDYIGVGKCRMYRSCINTRYTQQSENKIGYLFNDSGSIFTISYIKESNIPKKVKFPSIEQFAFYYYENGKHMIGDYGNGKYDPDSNFFIFQNGEFQIDCIDNDGKWVSFMFGSNRYWIPRGYLIFYGYSLQYSWATILALSKQNYDVSVAPDIIPNHILNDMETKYIRGASSNIKYAYSQLNVKVVESVFGVWKDRIWDQVPEPIRKESPRPLLPLGFTPVVVKPGGDTSKVKTEEINEVIEQPLVITPDKVVVKRHTPSKSGELYKKPTVHIKIPSGGSTLDVNTVRSPIDQMKITPKTSGFQKGGSSPPIGRDLRKYIDFTDLKTVKEEPIYEDPSIKTPTEDDLHDTTSATTSRLNSPLPDTTTEKNRISGSVDVGIKGHGMKDYIDAKYNHDTNTISYNNEKNEIVYNGYMVVYRKKPNVKSCIVKTINNTGASFYYMFVKPEDRAAIDQTFHDQKFIVICHNILSAEKRLHELYIYSTISYEGNTSKITIQSEDTKKEPITLYPLPGVVAYHVTDDHNLANDYMVQVKYDAYRVKASKDRFSDMTYRAYYDFATGFIVYISDSEIGMKGHDTAVGVLDAFVNLSNRIEKENYDGINVRLYRTLNKYSVITGQIVIDGKPHNVIRLYIGDETITVK